MSSAFGMYVDNGCLVVPIRLELDDDGVRQLQAEVLRRISRAGLRGVVIDLAGVSVLDSHLARELFDIGKMAALVGARMVISGINPGMAMALVDLGFEAGAAETVVHIEQALHLMRTRGFFAGNPGAVKKPAIDQGALR